MLPRHMTNEQLAEYIRELRSDIQWNKTNGRPLAYEAAKRAYKAALDETRQRYIQEQEEGLYR